MHEHDEIVLAVRLDAVILNVEQEMELVLDCSGVCKECRIADRRAAVALPSGGQQKPGAAADGPVTTGYRRARRAGGRIPQIDADRQRLGPDGAGGREFHADDGLIATAACFIKRAPFIGRTWVSLTSLSVHSVWAWTAAGAVRATGAAMMVVSLLNDSFCKDFSGSKRALVEVFIIRLHGYRLPECLVRPIGVVEALEFGQLDVQGADAQLASAGLVGLAAAGRVGALDAAVANGSFGRQREQRDAAPPAGDLELGRGLAAAVDLHRLEVERCLADQAVEESCGAGCGGGRAGREAALARQHRADLGAPPKRKIMTAL